MNRIQQWVLILLFCFPILLGAQQSEQKVSTDSSAIHIHSFTENIAQKYSGDAFEYEYTEEEAHNMLARVIYWILDALGETFGVEISPQTIEVTKTIIYILFILLAIYICSRVFMNTTLSSFFVKPTTSMAPIIINEEEITTTDFDALIHNALLQKEYRVAIRYLYLKTLRELTKTDRIAYHAEKTNATYITEITDLPLRQNFSRVSYIYEYTWYGEFEVNEAHYTQIKTSFDHLFTTLQAHG